MSARSEFDAVYTRFSENRPIYMYLREIKTGIPRWRLHVFEKGAAWVDGDRSLCGGDAELLCIEAATEEECLRKGIEALTDRLKTGEGGKKEC